MARQTTTIKIYTDGACSGNPGPGGWSAIFCIKNELKTLCGHDSQTTNNQMELCAVVNALDKILHIKSKNVEYEIYSDSAYVINGIGSWLESWKKQAWKNTKGDPVKNAELWQKCDKLLDTISRRRITVRFTKVKGHAGNPLNEYADKVAKSEAEKAKG